MATNRRRWVVLVVGLVGCTGADPTEPTTTDSVDVIHAGDSGTGTWLTPVAADAGAAPAVATVDCFADEDGDGYGGAFAVAVPEGAGVRRGCPVGTDPRGGDCCDGNADVRPGQLQYFTEPDAVCGIFDYDCSGATEPQPAATCATSTACGGCHGGPHSLAGGCGGPVDMVECACFIGVGCQISSSRPGVLGCH